MKLTETIISAIIKRGIVYEADKVDMTIEIPLDDFPKFVSLGPVKLHPDEEKNRRYEYLSGVAAGIDPIETEITPIKKSIVVCFKADNMTLRIEK